MRASGDIVSPELSTGKKEFSLWIKLNWKNKKRFTEEQVEEPSDPELAQVHPSRSKE